MLDAGQLAAGDVQLFAQLLDDDHVVGVAALQALDGLDELALRLHELRGDLAEIFLEAGAQAAQILDLLVEAAFQGDDVRFDLLTAPVGDTAGRRDEDGEEGRTEEAHRNSASG